MFQALSLPNMSWLTSWDGRTDASRHHTTPQDDAPPESQPLRPSQRENQRRKVAISRISGSRIWRPRVSMSVGNFQPDPTQSCDPPHDPRPKHCCCPGRGISRGNTATTRRESRPLTLSLPHSRVTILFAHRSRTNYGTKWQETRKMHAAHSRLETSSQVMYLALASGQSMQQLETRLARFLSHPEATPPSARSSSVD